MSMPRARDACWGSIGIGLAVEGVQVGFGFWDRV